MDLRIGKLWGGKDPRQRRGRSGAKLILLQKTAPAEPFGVPPACLFAVGCKPNSVSPGRTRLRRPFLWAGCCQPAQAAYPRMCRLSPACPVAEALRLFGLAAGGVCLAVRVTPNAVRSYRTISPLPEEIPFGMSPGGLLSVALSVGLLRLDVIKHQDPSGRFDRPLQFGLSSSR